MGTLGKIPHPPDGINCPREINNILRLVIFPPVLMSDLSSSDLTYTCLLELLLYAIVLVYRGGYCLNTTTPYIINVIQCEGMSAVAVFIPYRFSAGRKQAGSPSWRETVQGRCG